jgi:hypothetical protein
VSEVLEIPGEAVRVRSGTTSQANPSRLALALKPTEWYQIFGLWLEGDCRMGPKEFAGNLTGPLKELPVAKACAALMRFQGIPGSTAFWSGRAGKENDTYGRNYIDAQQVIAAEVVPKLDARICAYLP